MNVLDGTRIDGKGNRLFGTSLVDAYERATGPNSRDRASRQQLVDETTNVIQPPTYTIARCNRSAPASDQHADPQLPSPAPLMHRFTVQQLLAVTFACSVIFAACKAMGMSGTIAFGVLSMIGTPIVSFIAACVAKDCTLKQRVIIAVSISSVSFIAASAVASSYRALAPMAIYGLLLWLIQWVMIGFLYCIWKSGIDSVRRAEEELKNKSKQKEER